MEVPCNGQSLMSTNKVYGSVGIGPVLILVLRISQIANSLQYDDSSVFWLTIVASYKVSQHLLFNSYMMILTVAS